MDLPLAGIRVLDLSRVLAGPFATMTLADLGADVVKVEPPGGDDSRKFGPPFSGSLSTYFLSVNRGKRSIRLDLKAEADRALCRDLAAVADVLVENFRPGVLERLGLDPADLRRANPGLVVCRISAFGQDDPRPGYDIVAQHLSGVTALSGEPDGAPMKSGASIADVVTGQNAVQAILAALVRRGRTGRGALLDVRMIDSMRGLLAYHAASWLSAGVPPPRTGNQHTSVHPYGVYRTADGQVVLAVARDGQFAALAALLDRPGLPDDPRFSTNVDRVVHRAELDTALEPALAAWSTEVLLAALSAASIPAGPVLGVPDALADAPVVWHAHPELGPPSRVGSLPPGFRVDGEVPAALAGPPAVPGQDRDAVLADWLGRSE